VNRAAPPFKCLVPFIRWVVAPYEADLDTF
jgi:hypothetical protein